MLHFGLRGRMRSTCFVFSEKGSEFWDSTFPTFVKKINKPLVRFDPHPIIICISKYKIDRRRSRNAMGPFRILKNPMKK